MSSTYDHMMNPGYIKWHVYWYLPLNDTAIHKQPLKSRHFSPRRLLNRRMILTRTRKSARKLKTPRPRNESLNNWCLMTVRCSCKWVISEVGLICISLEHFVLFLQYNGARWHVACGAEGANRILLKTQQQSLISEVMTQLLKMLCSFRNHFLFASPHRRKCATS